MSQNLPSGTQRLRTPQPGDAAAVRPGATAVTVSGLAKVYPTKSGPLEALRDVGFSVENGEFLSLIGPSGCGKSTVLKIVAGLLPFDAGDVEVRGEAARAGRHDVAVMFQSPVLLPWRTVLGNVLLPMELLRAGTGRKTRENALRLIELVGLSGFSDVHPFQLSGGMRQRAALARLLVTEPEILLMDEPLSALDEITRERLVFELAGLHEQLGVTVVYVTHNIAEALILSDRVAVMGAHPGRVIDVVAVDLPRPRSSELMGTPEFAEAGQKIRKLLGTTQ